MVDSLAKSEQRSSADKNNVDVSEGFEGAVESKERELNKNKSYAVERASSGGRGAIIVFE